MSPAMTVAPARMHAYSGEDPMEIIDYHGRKLERWRALAEETGRLSALVELSKQVRNDSAAIVDRQNARDAELNARQDSIAERERIHAVHVTQFVDFVGKASVLFDRLHKLRADQAEEPLAAPPGIENKLPEPVLELEGDSISGTSPGNASPGEPSEDPTKEDQEGDPHGEFPRLTKPIAMDQPEFPDPELPHPPVVQQPIAAGLDKE
jgi:hypothetical protein